MSPVSSMSGEELTAAVRRSRRRQGFFDKQMSCDSQDNVGEGEAVDRVRFDDNVSFIEATTPDIETDGRLRAEMTTFKVILVLVALNYLILFHL